MKFSEELNKYMTLLSCSPKELSETSGLSPTLISRYLNNKRTPRVQSDYFKKITESLYKISLNKNIKINYDNLTKTLINSIDYSDIDFDVFVNNFNVFLYNFKISITEIANYTGYDSSFISRLKNKSRKPADLDNFIDTIGDFTVNKFQTINDKENMASFLTCDISIISNPTTYKKAFVQWLTIKHEENNTAIKNFLSTLDNFELNDFINNSKLSKIKIPTSPVILKTSKTYFGKKGRKQSEADFLKTTLLSKSKEPIYFYNNLPMSEASTDENFKQKWILAITMILKKGLHLNIIHNVDRPINEMLIGLESWMPIYMTGSISPYYFVNQPSNMFLGSYCSSGSVALSGECNPEDEENSRFYLTAKKDEVKYYNDRHKYMLSKAQPLMDIFKENDTNNFENFLKEQRVYDKKNANITFAKKDCFKNIDFIINKNKWIIINKELSPKIHFVIYNKKLATAIETFLLN